MTRIILGVTRILVRGAASTRRSAGTAASVGHKSTGLIHVRIRRCASESMNVFIVEFSKHFSEPLYSTLKIWAIICMYMLLIFLVATSCFCETVNILVELETFKDKILKILKKKTVYSKKNVSFIKKCLPVMRRSSIETATM